MAALIALLTLLALTLTLQLTHACLRQHTLTGHLLRTLLTPP
jgi:hypothetical protein